MNAAIEISKKNELWVLIKRLGFLYDEDGQFLTSYAQEVYFAHKLNLDVAIVCFRDLVSQAEWIMKGKK